MNLIDRFKAFFIPRFAEADGKTIDENNTRFAEAAGKTVDDEDDGYRRLTGDSKRDLAPTTQARAREVSAYLWQANLLANRIIELPLAFLLADGVRLTVSDPESKATLDRFWVDPINSMDLKLEKKVRELAIFGEQCYPAFVNEMNGALRLGYLDPALIETVVTDPDNKEQPIGIVTVKNKHGKARRYRVIVNGDEDVFTQRTQQIRETFTDGECFYYAVNALSSGVRGRPDMLASADWLDAYDDFLFGEADRTKYLRAFVWDVTLKGASKEDVKERSRDIAPPSPNSVRVHNDSEEWKAVTPGINSADTSESARLFRNHLLGGATIPEHWFGGGGDVNRSVGDSMGDPAFKVMSMRQRIIKHILEDIGRYVLRQKAKADGAQIDFGLPEYQVVAVFPEMIVRDTTRYAAALQQVVIAAAMAVERGFLSKKTAVLLISAVTSQLGVDIDVDEELEMALLEARQKAEEDVFTNPLANEK
ncbi:hypothetical protein [Azonexus sp.]|jgi:hypothetical protein|uniref:hypothetical protein n=1 Tax=Azonexus sp. TaxID=1872668 RepID=UPI0028296B5B|nr:hypothetical protein [Azonexus sp.]MDR1995116.1 hypothetical protein [Azonexus sp.]